MKVTVSASLELGDTRGRRKEGWAEEGNGRKEGPNNIEGSNPKKEMKALCGSFFPPHEMLPLLPLLGKETEIRWERTF
jgi:hypothetical protein